MNFLRGIATWCYFDEFHVLLRDRLTATPVGALLSSMIFAFFDGLSNILQVLKIPSEFIQMLPYLATIAGLTVYSIQKAAAAEKKMKNLKEAN